MPTKKATNSDAPPEEKLLAILKICQKMNSKRDPALLLDLLAREAARLVEADRATINNFVICLGFLRCFQGFRDVYADAIIFEQGVAHTHD